MRKLIYVILSVWLLCFATTIPANAADETHQFSFELSVDGKDTKEVKTGDIITFVLKLHRTDASEPYMMYAMQDEIRYDSAFFELVEGSAVLGNGIVSTDIAKVDQYREFYMNYLSMSGGTQWDDDMLVGSIQLKVTGKSGVSQITNQDYLVSLKDGSGSYACDAGDVTIVVSTDCVVSFQTSGGSSVPDQHVQYGEKIVKPEDPAREGYCFDGWYADIHLTEEWDFDNDVVRGNMSLYAKWTVENSSDAVLSGDMNNWSCIWWIVLLILILAIYWIVKKKNSSGEK